MTFACIGTIQKTSFSMGKKNVPPLRDGGVSARDRAYQYVRRKIASGELAAGDAISELSMAKALAVSRTPVREALGQLAAEGILEQNPNRRAVVATLTRKDIIELYELREALEVYAVRKAARHPLHQADLDKLFGLTDAVQTVKDELERSGGLELDHEQMLRFAAYDLAFHSHLMRLAANDRILKVVNDARLLIRIFAIRRHGHTVALLSDIHTRHGEVVHAIAEQNPERAMRAISEHIQLSLRERLDDLDHGEIEASIRGYIPNALDAKPLLLAANLRDTRRTE